MDAEAYAKMRETGIAPCGCALEIMVAGDGTETVSVGHTCNPNRMEESDAANEKSMREHMERQERKMLMSMIPLETLREMVHGKAAARK